jgi:hypothetical protein
MSRQPCDQACQRTSIPVKNGRAEAPNLLRLSNNLGSLMRIPTTKSKPAPEKAATHVMARSRFPVWLPAVLLVLVTIALYWPATHHDFVQYDDNQYILDNTHVTGGLTLENARWAFRTGYAANWHPVTWLSHMADCQLFGLNPWGHHLTNLLFHALNAALVFVLLQQLSGAVWRSLFVAALFALHPLRVESVAWVAERKDVLSGFFGLLSLVLYARYAGKSVIGNQLSVTSGQASGMAAAHKASRITLPASLFYVLSLCCFACGLMSKPMLVTWPFVMLLLDYWPLRRFEPSTPNSRLSTVLRLVMEKLPFFALSAVASVVTVAVQKNAGAVRTVEHLPLGARGENAVISYVRYLAKLFWPTDLAVFYPLPTHWPMAEVLLAGGLILGISAVLFVKRGRYPFLLIGWLWFVGTLVPVIGLAQVGEQSMADRYTYIPSLGVLILTVWGTHQLTRRWRYHVIALAVAGATAIVLCFALTRRQLEHWRETATLFRHALEVTKDNHIAHNCLGVALYKNLGIALYRRGSNEEAISQFQEALRLKPDYADARRNLDVVLASKTRASGQPGGSTNR